MGLSGGPVTTQKEGAQHTTHVVINGLKKGPVITQKEGAQHTTPIVMNGLKKPSSAN